ncbi:MAG: rhodanese-like domain-containing protein [Chloroflexota bacterium]|jgi:predicted sulfurtransferase|nr:rhodanese-like domain-containing protein [Chloroflexota bacterium]
MRRNKKSALLPIILFLIVLALSIGGLILAQNLRRARIADPSEVSNPDDVPRVTVSEAYQAVNNGEAVIVDTRSEIDYQNQHIAGAVNISLSEIEDRMSELDPDTWVITYCT